ncbi:hypothetical protein Hanom_Chr11g01028571 [Helianthus anomalus]
MVFTCSCNWDIMSIELNWGFRVFVVEKRALIDQIIKTGIGLLSWEHIGGIHFFFFFFLS